MMSNNKPFFSILLPTKNRSNVVANAITSVLKQSFTNFELIVSDNDDSLATYDVVKNIEDSRLKYFRTAGNLSMPDNWNNALSNASGLYVTVIQDKQIYYENTLECLYHTLTSREGVEVITFQSDHSIFIHNNEYVVEKHKSNAVWFESSLKILDDLVKKGPFSVWSRLPRMINSCVSHELIRRVSETTSLPEFFVDVTPDLSSSFIQLAMAKNIYHIDSSMVISTSINLSGGLAVRKRSQVGEKFFNEVRKKNEICTFVQIKNRHVVSNLIVNDYLNIRHILGGKLKGFSFCDSDYFRIYLNDVARNISEGIFFLDTFNDAHKLIRKNSLLYQVRLYGYFLLMLLRYSLSASKRFMARYVQLFLYRAGKPNSLIPIHELIDNFKKL